MPALIDELSVRGVLESCPLFKTLDEDQMRSLAAGCRLTRCDRGEPIWISGSQVDFFGVVAHGFVKLVRSNSLGSEVTLEIMGPNQVFGLLGAIAGCGCPLMAYGLTDTAYLRVPKAQFMSVYEANEGLKDILVRRTAIRMHQKLDFMAKLSTGSAEQRLSAILLMLADSYGSAVDGVVQLDVPLTRQNLGEMAGTTTETTIRVLSKWTQAGLIQTDQKRISICKSAPLERMLN